MRSRSHIIEAKDHLVTGETFKVLYDEALGYASTQIKKQINLSFYYPKETYVSHQQNPEGVNGKLYLLVQQLMLRYKYYIFRRNHSGQHLLDIGGGIGVFADYMIKKGYHASLVEPNSIAREISFNKGIESYHSLAHLANTKKYNTLSLWHTLEHVDNLNETLQQCNNSLKNDGLLIIAVPNLNSFDALYYGPFWAALDVPRHLWHFTPNGLKQLLEKNGFVSVNTYPLWFDAIYIAIISESYSANKLSLLRGLFIGLYSNIRAFFNREYSSKIFVFKKKN